MALITRWKAIQTTIAHRAQLRPPRRNPPPRPARTPEAAASETSTTSCRPKLDAEASWRRRCPAWTSPQNPTTRNSQATIVSETGRVRIGEDEDSERPASVHYPDASVTRAAPIPLVRNVAEHLARRAEIAPDSAAVLDPAGRGWRTTTYAELDARADAIARGLADLGLAPRDRVALLVPPSRDLVAVVFALFRLGAVPVVADPGRGASAL